MYKKEFRADSAKLLIEDIAQRGVTAKKALAGTGLTDGWLKDPNAVLTDTQYRKIVQNALDETRDPALGISLPQQLHHINRFDYWGYAILSSENWGQASRIAMEYWDVSGSLVRLKFMNEGKTCAWKIYPALDPKGLKIQIFAVERFLSTTLSNFIFTTGGPPPTKEVCLSYAPPDHAFLYKEFTDAPVLFNQPENLVRMDSKVLDRPLLMANREIMELCQRQCAKLLSNLRKSDELVELIRRIIIGSPGHFPGADEMAEKLGMSSRTLRRRLADSGVSYMKILDEVRTELAIGYLTSTKLSIDEISSLLMFSETTTFRRTFKKWVGESAAAVRKSALREED
jgi:AraC-like DNA-binding protein